MSKIFKWALLTIGMLAALPLAARAELTHLEGGSYHFFANGYGSLVVVGTNSVLVVDPAWTARGEAIKAAVAKVTDKPVSHVVLSHEHYDHVGGTDAFPGASIVCHENCADIFALDVQGSVPKEVTQSFDKEMTIDLGGRNVELKFLAAADGVATTVIYVPADQVVATADLYLPRELTNGGYLDDKNFLGTRVVLNEIANWPMRHAIGGHSPVTDPAAVGENAAYLNDLYAAVKTELDKAFAEGGVGAAWGLIFGPLPDSVKLPAYADWKGYDEHLPRHVYRMAMSILHGG